MKTTRTHGMSKHPVYRIWHSMRQRCQNPNRTDYHHYGGRGIKVCERWQKFEPFYADMGPRPEGMSLDRIDNNGPYSPENCRWANQREQKMNTRAIQRYEHNGKTLAASEWAKEIGVHPRTMRLRIAKMGFERAITARKQTWNSSL